MKVFVKNVELCNDCPNLGYIHYDGEGESCPYEYFDAVCSKTKKNLPNSLIVKDAEYQEYKDGGRPFSKPFIPVRNIPDWCPLKDV